MVTRWGLRGRRGPPIAGTPADWLDREAALHRADLDRRIDAALVASTGGHPARTGASARRARRWLAALARVPHADLTWWRIAEAVPRPVRVAAESLVLVVGVGLAIGAGFLISPVLGLGAGFAVSMHGGIPTGMPPQPHRASGWLRRLAGHGWLPAVVGLVYGAAFPPLLAPSVGVPAGLAAGAAAGLTAGLAAWLGRRGLVRATAERPDGAADPTAGLAEDRVVGLMSGFTIGLGFVLGYAVGHRLGLTELPANGVVVLVLGTALCGLSSASGMFMIIRGLLPLLRRGPLRTLGFLREAADRGLLSPIPGGYRFTDERLREHLARPGP